MTKIIDIINLPRDDKRPHVSIEYFPPKTEHGLEVRHVFSFLFCEICLERRR